MAPIALPVSDEASRAQEVLISDILRLKKEKNAVILSHNYQRPEVQRVADHIGDSYGLSAIAQKLDADTIVFCGVRFMAETAHILNPSKKVLLPEEMAGCALADTITGEQVRAWKAEHPGHPVVMYINSSAEVKAEVDAICTSSNATHIVDHMPGDTVLFGPDWNLARVVMSRSKKKIIPWQGHCPVHEAVTKDMLTKTLEVFPDAVVIVHPECNPEVVAMADEVLSTSEMLTALARRPEKRFIIGTEIGLIERARELYPHKDIHPIYTHKSCDESCACPFMKMTSLQSVKRSLETESHVITLEAGLRVRALRSVERMLALGLPKAG